MKNLANCNPREFLQQTNLIRKSVSKWLTDTDIINIRKRLPDIPENASSDEIAFANQEQARINFNAILDACLDEHPDETLEVLALICFIEPDEIENYKMIDLFSSMNEMINDKAVLSFFTSLMRLVNQIT